MGFIEGLFYKWSMLNLTFWNMRFYQVSMGCQATFLEAFTSQYGLTYIYIFCSNLFLSPIHVSQSSNVITNHTKFQCQPWESDPQFFLLKRCVFPGLEPVTGAPISIDRLGRQGVQHGSQKLGFHHFGWTKTGISPFCFAKQRGLCGGF